MTENVHRCIVKQYDLKLQYVQWTFFFFFFKLTYAPNIQYCAKEQTAKIAKILLLFTTLKLPGRGPELVEDTPPPPWGIGGGVQNKPDDNSCIVQWLAV